VSEQFFTFIGFCGKFFGLVTSFLEEDLLSRLVGGELSRKSLFERMLLIFLEQPGELP
jgi:hypothetical protein